MDSTEVINEINLRKRAEKISRDIFSILIDKFRFIKDQFANILNIIVNSTNYKYYISILLTLVFILLVILTNLINVPDKYVQIISLLLGGIIISIFYFFVYRNEQETNEGLAVKGDNGILSVLYNKENKKLVKKKILLEKMVNQ